MLQSDAGTRNVHQVSISTDWAMPMMVTATAYSCKFALDDDTNMVIAMLQKTMRL